MTRPAEGRDKFVDPLLLKNGFAAMSFAPSLRRRIKWAIAFFLVSVALVIWASIADKSRAPAWIAFMASGTWLAHVVLSMVLSQRYGLPIPQTFVDRHGLIKAGLWGWDEFAWSELSDFVVCATDNDGGIAHYLLAFATGEEPPQKQWARYWRAKLRLQLPYLQTDRNRDEAIYNSVCDWLNEWRRHVLADGPRPHQDHLSRVEGRFPIIPVSDLEYDTWWQVFLVRYPGIRRRAAESQ